MVIAGSVVIEQVFVLPGLGLLTLDALNNRDYPVISGVNVFMAFIVLFVNILVDLAYAWLDPRIQYR
jgi:peptide/nickel transport system permease protein